MEAAHQLLISYSQYNFSSPLSLCAAGANTKSFPYNPGGAQGPKEKSPASFQVPITNIFPGG